MRERATRTTTRGGGRGAIDRIFVLYDGQIFVNLSVIN